MSVAKMSELVNSMISDDNDDDSEAQEIPLPNVKSPILAEVIKFIEHYKEEPMTEIEKPLKSANMTEVVQVFFSLLDSFKKCTCLNKMSFRSSGVV